MAKSSGSLCWSLISVRLLCAIIVWQAMRAMQACLPEFSPNECNRKPYVSAIWSFALVRVTLLIYCYLINQLTKTMGKRASWWLEISITFCWTSPALMNSSLGLFTRIHPQIRKHLCSSADIAIYLISVQRDSFCYCRFKVLRMTCNSSNLAFLITVFIIMKNLI